MTETETILNAALDADPSDQVARRALADYYIELGDARGYGYKALAEQGKYPVVSKLNDGAGWFCYGDYLGYKLTTHDALYTGTHKSGRQSSDYYTFYSRFLAEEWAVHVLLTQGIVDSHGLTYDQ